MLTTLTWHFLCLPGVGYQSICGHLNNRPLKYSPHKPQHFTISTCSTEIYLFIACLCGSTCGSDPPHRFSGAGDVTKRCFERSATEKVLHLDAWRSSQGGMNVWAKDSTGLCWSKRVLWQAVTVTRHGIVMKWEQVSAWTLCSLQSICKNFWLCFALKQ